MGIFGGAQSRGNTEDANQNKALIHRLQSELQILEDDFKKLGQEKDEAHRLKAELGKELSLLTTRMRENEKIIGIKDRAYSLLEEELKRKKRALQNQPR